jgi:hypothetical protein
MRLRKALSSLIVVGSIVESFLSLDGRIGMGRTERSIVDNARVTLAPRMGRQAMAVLLH